jgi:HEAT repeat protein
MEFASMTGVIINGRFYCLRLILVVFSFGAACVTRGHSTSDGQGPAFRPCVRLDPTLERESRHEAIVSPAERTERHDAERSSNAHCFSVPVADLTQCIRIAAAITLFKSKGVEALPDAIEAISGENDVQQRITFLKALDINGKRGQAALAVPVLVRLAKGDDAAVQKTAIISLVILREENSLAGLIELLDDKKWEVRRLAAIGLERYGKDAKAAVPGLIRLLRAEHEGFPLEPHPAYGSLVVIGKAAAPSVARVLADEKNSNDSRYWAYRCLLAMEEEDTESAVTILVEVLADKDPVIRSDAIQILHRLGAKAKVAAGALEKLARESTSTDGVDAAMALYDLDPKQYDPLPVLGVAARSEDDSVRKRAIKGIGRLGTNAKEAIPILTRVVRQDPDSDFRLQAFKMVLEIKQPKADVVQFLKSIVDDKTQEDEMRSAAAERLRKLQAKE